MNIHTSRLNIEQYCKLYNSIYNIYSEYIGTDIGNKCCSFVLKNTSIYFYAQYGSIVIQHLYHVDGFHQLIEIGNCIKDTKTPNKTQLEYIIYKKSNFCLLKYNKKYLEKNTTNVNVVFMDDATMPYSVLNEMYINLESEEEEFQNITAYNIIPYNEISEYKRLLLRMTEIYKNISWIQFPKCMLDSKIFYITDSHINDIIEDFKKQLYKEIEK